MRIKFSRFGGATDRPVSADGMPPATRSAVAAIDLQQCIGWVTTTRRRWLCTRLRSSQAIIVRLTCRTGHLGKILAGYRECNFETLRDVPPACFASRRRAYIIAGAATVGLKGREGDILVRTSAACATYTAAGGVAVLLLAALT